MRLPNESRSACTAAPIATCEAGRSRSAETRHGNHRDARDEAIADLADNAELRSGNPRKRLHVEVYGLQRRRTLVACWHVVAPSENRACTGQGHAARSPQPLH